MKVLVVDDEDLARQRLNALVAEYGNGYEVVGEAANGQQALDQIQSLQPDIVLLDIRMPGMDGIEVARHLITLQKPPAVIFTTAYDEHALDAFETQAIGYLLKPIQADRLARALDTAKTLQQGQIQKLAEQQNEKVREHIGVHMRGDLHLVAVKDVIYFRAEQKYIEMYYSNNNNSAMVLIEESLKSLEEEFADRFMRIHRNALVSMPAIVGLERDSLGRSRVKLKNCDDLLEVSRRHVAALRKLLKSRAS